MSKSLNQPALPPTTGYIRKKQLIKQVPFSHSTLWRKVNNGEFPKPIKLSMRVTAWRIEDVQAWMQARYEESNPLPKILRKPIPEYFKNRTKK